MRRFYTYSNIRRISDEEIESIRCSALKGDPAGCYKMAQLYLAWHFDEDYAEETHQLLRKASEGGIKDADVALAIMYLEGELEPYNPVEGRIHPCQKPDIRKLGIC